MSGAFSGEVTVTLGSFGEFSFHITDIDGDHRDVPNDGDTVYILSEALYLEMRAAWEADGG